MRFLLAVLLLTCTAGRAQEWLTQGSLLRDLRDHDSVIIYQCHVEKAEQMIRTASGQTITGMPGEMSLTEKYVLKRKDSLWTLKRYTSALNILPNRKFSGLKIREKTYWQFSLAAECQLDRSQIILLDKIQQDGRECTEYDFAISVYTRNQVIFKRGKKFRQLVLPEKQVISMILPAIRTGDAQ